MDLARLVSEFGIADIDARLQAVDALIGRTLLDDDSVLGPASLRVANAGGKRLRPLFTIICAELGGVYDDTVTAAAAAGELVQVGSLVHDDIFESAATRRGTPTINAVEGASHALLAGDFILAKAGELAAKVSSEAAALIGRTVTALCEGQLLEMEYLFDPDRPVEAHLRSIRGKTAALFECACRLGAMCAGLTDDAVEAVGSFGDRFGMAFQVLDDVLDIVGDPGRLGKPVGIDVGTGVYTLPVLVALTGRHGADLRRLLTRRENNDVLSALQLVRDSDGIVRAMTSATAYAAEAQEAADALPASRLAASLGGFARTYQAWALEHFAPGLRATEVG